MEQLFEMLKEAEANRKADMEKLEADRKRDKEEMEEKRRKEKEERKKDREDFLAKLDADRKTDKEEMKADRRKDREDFLAKLDVNQKQTEVMLTKLDAYQEKATADKEELKAEMRSMRSELDDQIQHRVENILAIVEHDKQTLRSEITEQIDVSLCARTDKLQENLTKNYNETCAAIDETKREFQARLDIVQMKAERGNTATIVASTAQPPTFYGNSTWSVFRRQFETVAEHNQWTDKEKSTYLITALKGRAAEILPGIPANATYEETLQALEDRFGDQHFAAAYRCQLRTRTQKPGESLQDFATAIELLSHRAYPDLPADHIGREAGIAFVYGIRDADIRFQLLLGGEKKVNEALRRALELQAVLIAARPHEGSTKTYRKYRSSPTHRGDGRQSGCWSCGKLGHFASNCPYEQEGYPTVGKQATAGEGGRTPAYALRPPHYPLTVKRVNANHNEMTACQEIEARLQEGKPASVDTKPAAAQQEEVPTVIPVRVTMACRETEARPEGEKPASANRKPEAAGLREVPIQDAEVMPVGEPKKKRRRDRKKRNMKNSTREKSGPQKKLAAPCRKTSRRATVARRWRNDFKKETPQGTFGCRREDLAPRSRASKRLEDQEERRSRQGRTTHQGLLRRHEEPPKKEMTKDWTLWRGRPPPKRKKRLQAEEEPVK
ncbi:hypothetical protein B7P43_G13216 [Cryptotermes secundus]|uniref:CCHC-type domain-containing protein n=1 Tax=Cryptotermes secundus TaxID=105785 RepID=A0A2J7REY1_9NEOP|nr:hypothetical protein B7P43_G13216 [Cryptotermes secundus]